MTRAYALVALGVGWLAFDLYSVLRNVILRETSFGAAAELVDKFPSWISELLFLIFWGILLFGWLIPVGVGFKALLRIRR